MDNIVQSIGGDTLAAIDFTNEKRLRMNAGDRINQKLNLDGVPWREVRLGMFVSPSSDNAPNNQNVGTWVAQSLKSSAAPGQNVFAFGLKNNTPNEINAANTSFVGIGNMFSATTETDSISITASSQASSATGFGDVTIKPGVGVGSALLRAAVLSGGAKVGEMLTGSVAGVAYWLSLHESATAPTTNKFGAVYFGVSISRELKVGSGFYDYTVSILRNNAGVSGNDWAKYGEPDVSQSALDALVGSGTALPGSGSFNKILTTSNTQHDLTNFFFRWPFNMKLRVHARSAIAYV